MKKTILSGLIFATVLMFAAGSAFAQSVSVPQVPKGGYAPDAIPGQGPGMWDKSSPHTMALNDYYSQTNECQLFYNETAPLRRDYYNKKFQHSENMRSRNRDGVQTRSDLGDLENRIEKQQPPRFSCPW